MTKGMESIETVVIGGGQAGLAVSYYLQQHGAPHVALEQAGRPAHVWSDERWDSFTLVTPNWTLRLPGAEYQGSAPDGFMSREELGAYFDRYPRQFGLPVRYNTRVTAVERDANGQRFTVRTENGAWQARNVAIATGALQTPKRPAFSAEIAPAITQIAAAEYHNPGALAPGAVLVAGAGQSGMQIAEELYQSGRTVYLAVSGAPRVPRRYRGHDIFWWLNEAGFVDRPASVLPSPKARFMPAPQASGKNGGHSLNAHQFMRDGVRLLGHVRGAQGSRLQIAPDLQESLAKTDKLEAQLIKLIDDHIARRGLDVAAEEVAYLRDGFSAPLVEELDLAREGITSIIWATGFRYDFSLVHASFLDDDGFPIQEHGVTGIPGLYTVGLPWSPGQRTGLLLGVAEQAREVAEHIVERRAA